jgi:hypothetical protein
MDFCCDYSPKEHCDLVKDLSRQYQGSPNIAKILKVWHELSLGVYDSISAICGATDCTNLSGDALTAYGESIGFPRIHCDVECGNLGNYTIDDDNLYCKFINAHLISRQGNTIEALCDSLEVLFGSEAFIISSKSGKTRVSSGRPLLEKERAIIELYRRFLPHSCATKMEIFEIGSIDGLFGINCGTCNTYQGPCSGAKMLCDEISCDGLSYYTYTQAITEDSSGFTLSSPSSIELCGEPISEFFVELGLDGEDGNETFTKIRIKMDGSQDSSIFYAIRFGPLGLLSENSFSYEDSGNTFWEWDLTNLLQEENLELLKIMRKENPLKILKEC